MENIDWQYRLASGEAKDHGETSTRKGSLFSNFSDQKKYNGAIPTGQFFQQLFVNFSKGIGDFMSNEAKKWPVTGLCVDTIPKLDYQNLGQVSRSKDVWWPLLGNFHQSWAHLNPVICQRRKPRWVPASFGEFCWVTTDLRTSFTKNSCFGYARKRRKPHSRDHP